MILDGLYLFDTAAAVSAAAGTQASTNIIDLVNRRDMGIGDNPALKLLVQCATTFTGGTSLLAALQGSTDNVTWTTMIQTPAVVPVASLVQGRRLLDVDVPRPAPGQAVPRYLRMLYTTAGTFTTAGGASAITSAIVIDRQDQVYYPPGIAINN